jgi:hypothetical protein
MARFGWGTGAWGSFKWGGEETGGEQFYYTGHVYAELSPASTVKADITVSTGLTVESLSDYKLRISLYTDGLPMSLENSSVATPTLASNLSISLEPKASYTYELTRESNLDMRVICINRPRITPLVGLDLELANTGDLSVSPLLDDQSIELANTSSVTVTYAPKTALSIGLENTAEYIVDITPITGLSFELLPISDVYGFACGDRKETDYNCNGKDSTNWNTTNNRITDFIDEVRTSTPWTNTAKRETVYNG